MEIRARDAVQFSYAARRDRRRRPSSGFRRDFAESDCYSLTGAKLTFFAPTRILVTKMPIRLHRKFAAVLVSHQRETVGISIPASMQVVAKRCLRSW